MIGLPTICCRHCGDIRLILWGEISPAEYFEKVVLHEADCPGRPNKVTEWAKHYMMLEHDPRFGLAMGDVLVCTDYILDPDKLTVCLRLADDFEPQCNVYRSQVRLVPGSTEIQFRTEPPYGFERVPD